MLNLSRTENRKRLSRAVRNVFLAASVFGFIAVGYAETAAPAEVKLKAGFFFGAKKSLLYRGWQGFVDKVNNEGKGLVQIPTVAGPESFSRRQWCNALKSGILDIVGIAQSWCNNLVPGTEALNAANKTFAEQRAAGAYDYMRPLFAAKANAYYYAQYGFGQAHHFFTNKPVNRVADFKADSSRVHRSQRCNDILLIVTPGQLHRIQRNANRRCALFAENNGACI